jgi:hypothetical protein
MYQSVEGMQHQEYRRAGNEGGLGQARQRLGLAVTEAVLLVGGHQRIANREQIDERGGDIHHGVDQ